MYSNLVERDIETLIDNSLNYLKWELNPKDINNCTVFHQRAKTDKQMKLLNGKRPDYVLYPKGSDEPIAVIEVKRPFEDINKAKQQAIEYATRLNAPIVFATDGIYTKTFHLKKRQPLFLNGEEVDDLLDQSILLNYLHDNIYYTQEKKVIQSRQELINIFKSINNNFRDAGVSSGLPRIHLFCNILFLKVISELSEIQDGIITLPPKEYLWNNFKNKKGLDLLDFLNKQSFDYFKRSYGGEVLSKIDILPGKENVLNTIISKLDDLWLSDTNTDIKGDAFEFFLRSYGGAETDFGEYFTPRHIIRTLTKIMNPQFGEKVYDPFCGTGGMLIESFKHMKMRMPLNPQTIKTLKEKTIYGGELSTMYRVAKMNMILAGDGHSNIMRQDSYETPKTSEFDVIMTNIPFGIRMKTDFLGKYGYNGRSAEICGILHCIDSLNSKNENARAGILVPEGILFNESKLYTRLRQELVERCDIQSVISLPKGIFTDASIKSNILILKKKRNASKNHIWYFGLNNDGFTLDKSRKKTNGENDLDILKAETDLKIEDEQRLRKLGFKILYKDEIKKNEYILLPNQYEDQEIEQLRFKTKSLKELEKHGLIKMLKGSGLSKSSLSMEGSNKCILYGELYTLYKDPLIESVVSKTQNSGKVLSSGKDVLIPATTTADKWGIAVARSLNEENVIIGGDINVIRILTDKISPDYLSLMLNFPLRMKLSSYAKGANILHLSNKNIAKIKIPLPDLKKQEAIVNQFKEKKHIIKEHTLMIEKTKEEMHSAVNNSVLKK